MGGSDDASMMGSGGDAAGGGNDAAEEPSGPVVPCDAAIVLPTSGGAAGAACGACIESKCMKELQTCGDDCVCVSGIECVVPTRTFNFTLCAEAMSALGAGNVGLMGIAGCVASNCQVCFNPDAG
jgi:hypothetical protein